MVSSDEVSSVETYVEVAVMLPQLCSEHLKLPNAFVEKLSRKIPEKVALRSQFGEVWPVKLAETEGGLFIQGGWSTLVSDNSLQPGDFLVLKYHGHNPNLLDIKIYEKSGVEKEEVCSSAAWQERGRSIAILEEEEEEVERNENKPRNAGKSQLGEQFGRSTKCSSCAYHPRNLEKGITRERLPLKNPFFVTSGKICLPDQLNIPRDIMKKFGVKFGETVHLQDPKGRSFHGIVVLRKDGRVAIKDAFNKFRKWNLISEDDNLVCEVITSKEQICEVLKVHVHPIGECHVSYPSSQSSV